MRDCFVKLQANASYNAVSENSRTKLVVFY